MSVIQKRARNRKDGVKELPRSNIYEAGTASVAELFEGYIQGSAAGNSCIALALSAHPLGATEQNAIEKSLAALGYGKEACTYATLSPRGADGDANAALYPQALFLLVEGLDPLCVIAADAAATQALGQTYRTVYAPDSAIRVFGRPAVSFRSLAELLESDAGKQRAWRLFKSIRRSYSHPR